MGCRLSTETGAQPFREEHRKLKDSKRAVDLHSCNSYSSMSGATPFPNEHDDTQCHNSLQYKQYEQWQDQPLLRFKEATRVAAIRNKCGSASKDDAPDNLPLQEGIKIESSCSVSESKIPDVVWFNIFSYSHSNEIILANGTTDLFNTVGLVSKYLQHQCITYARITPMALSIKDTLTSSKHDLHKLAWICRNQVKLIKLHFCYGNRVDMGVLMHILKRCDVVNLRSLTVSSLKHSYDSRSGTMLPVFVPDHIFSSGQQMRKRIRNREKRGGHGVTERDLHTFLANMLGVSMTNLTHMSLELRRGIHSLHLIQLENISQTITTLKLSFRTQRDLLGVGEVIARMPRLEKLMLVTDTADGYDSLVTMSIRSQSLRQITTCRSVCSHGQIVIEQCICPSLENITGVYCRDAERHDFYGDVDEEDHCVCGLRLTNDVLYELAHTWHTSVRFRAGDRPQIGLVAPHSCVVTIHRMTD